MKSIRIRFRNKLICNMDLLITPPMRPLQLLQPLPAGQCELDLLSPSKDMIPRLVKHLFLLQNR